METRRRTDSELCDVGSIEAVDAVRSRDAVLNDEVTVARVHRRVVAHHAAFAHVVRMKRLKCLKIKKNSNYC